MNMQSPTPLLRWRPVIDMGTRLRVMRRDYAHRIGRRVTQAHMAQILDVPLSSYKQWEAGNNEPADPVDLARRIQQRVGAEVSILVGAWMQAAGIKSHRYDGVSAHALRHTAASDVLDQCNDLRAVQAMLGHRHLNTTAIYLRRTSAHQLREAMAGRSYTR